MHRMAAHVSQLPLPLIHPSSNIAMHQVSERTEDTINDMAIPDSSDPHASRKRKHNDESHEASAPSGPHYSHEWNEDYPAEEGQVKLEHQAIDKQEAALMAKEAAASKNSIYLANLTWFTTDVEVERLCSEFGQLINLRFIEDRFNGKSKVSSHFSSLTLYFPQV
jgi:RNA recognition motif-containing protein